MARSPYSSAKGISESESKPLIEQARAHLYWFKLRDASRLFSEFEQHFLAAASKYAIPKEKYGDYGVLEP